jgi:dTDP-glucose pyrophosphorylase/predicted transcriptional regulator
MVWMEQYILTDISPQNLLDADAKIVDAIKSFEELSFRMICIVDKNNEYIGSLTEGDIRRYLLNGGKLEDFIVKATNVMSFYCRLEDDYEQIVNEMKSKFHKIAPVLNSENKVIALLSIDKPIIKKQKVNVLIMAGGLGSRLKPITNKIPKPLVQINGKPIIVKLIEQLVASGIVDITISVNYLRDQIKNHLGNGSKFNANIDYVEEETPLGTAGSLNMLKPIENEILIVLNGDLVTDLNFLELVNSHRKSLCEFTVGFVEKISRGDYGVLSIDENRVLDLNEKPEKVENIFSGIVVLNINILGVIPAGYLDMTDLIKLLLLNNFSINAFKIQSSWIDIGTPENLNIVNSTLRGLI